jgi:hypothetical protein
LENQSEAEVNIDEAEVVIDAFLFFSTKEFWYFLPISLF